MDDVDAGSTGQRERRRSTIRLRVTILASILVAFVLAGGAVGLVLLQRAQLTNNLDSSLEQRADQLVEALVDGDPNTVIANSNSEDRAAQLVTLDGEVLAATPNLAGRPAVTAAPATQTIVTTTQLPLEDDVYRLLSRRVDVGDRVVVLHVVQNIDDLQDAIRALTIALAVAVPAGVALMAGLAWSLVGRTLRPVEAIRAQVAGIAVDGTADTVMGRRVSVPPHADEIGRLAQTMNDMLERLDRAHEQQRRFVADASHELRSPLTRIRTELEVDLNRPDAADLRATHRVVLDETIGLQRLIEGLLHLARSDASSVEVDHEPLDLDDLVLSEARLVRGDGVVVDTSGVSGAHVRAHGGDMTRAIRNLFDNARRHAASRIVIALAEADGAVVLSIADDGPGIAAEDHDRVFERFTRLDDARATADGGTGLGLAIARQIIEQHGGTVVVDPSSTIGARFVVTLPAA